MTIAPPLSTSSEAHRQPPSMASPPLGRILRALIRKELRQNLIYLALIIAVEAIVVIFLQYSANSSLLDNGNRYDNIMLYPATTTAVTFCSIIAAFFIGIFQPLADRPFDTWAFLVHRPVPRTVQYVGRVIAGMILYCIAFGLPAAILSVLAATPLGGLFFIWQYILPVIADFFGALPYYFVGLLIMERVSRLHGSRMIPLVLAITVSIVLSNVFYFMNAVLIALAVTALLSFAAEGSAISHGFMLPVPRRSRIALFLSLILGFSLIGLLIAVTTGEHYSSNTRSTLEKYVSRHQPLRSWQLLSQERALVAPQVFGTFSTFVQTANETGPERVSLDNSNTLSGPDGKPLSREMLNFYQTIYNYPVYPDRSNVQTLSKTGFRDLNQLVGISHVSHSEPDIYRDETWYAVHSQHIFYIYETTQTKGNPKTTHTFLGTFGANGFVPPGARAVPFDGNLNLPYIQTPHTFYFLDVGLKKLESLFQTSADETLLDYERYYYPNDPQRKNIIYMEAVSLLTTKRFIAFSHEKQIRVQLPITHDLTKYKISVNSFPTATLADPASHEWVIRYLPTQAGPDPSDTWEFYDDQGTLLSKNTFPDDGYITPPHRIHAPSLEFPSNIIRVVHRNEIREGVIIAATNPLSSLLTAAALPLFMYHYRLPDSNPLQELFMHPYIVVPIAIVLLLSAAAGWMLAGWYRVKYRLGWTFLSFFCGPIACLTLVSCHTFPRRSRCPHCQKLRPLNEDLCPHCHSPWPLPTPTATQIFA